MAPQQRQNAGTHQEDPHGPGVGLREPLCLLFVGGPPDAAGGQTEIGSGTEGTLLRPVQQSVKKIVDHLGAPVEELSSLLRRGGANAVGIRFLGAVSVSLQFLNHGMITPYNFLFRRKAFKWLQFVTGL
jgi:hypothetical protein